MAAAENISGAALLGAGALSIIIIINLFQKTISSFQLEVKSRNGWGAVKWAGGVSEGTE